MKITYEYVTGEVVEIEAEEKFAHVVLELDHKEFCNNRTAKRHHIQLSAMSEDSDRFATSEDDPWCCIIWDPYAIEDPELKKAMDQLTPKQKDVCRAVFWDGMSISAYAEKSGISRFAASKRLRRAKEKIRKFY